MTLTPPPHTVTHGRQVKDLIKLSVLMFYVAVSLSDIEKFCRGRNRFLPRQNLSHPIYDFLDGFSQLRMVVEQNQKYVQNRLEISFMNMFSKILYNV
jgi:hypothetical protein